MITHMLGAVRPEKKPEVDLLVDLLQRWEGSFSKTDAFGMR